MVEARNRRDRGTGGGTSRRGIPRRDGSGPDPRQPLPAGPFEPVIHAFLKIADACGDAPAIVGASDTWTFGHLRTAALALASELEALGVRPGDRIAVTGVRSHGLVTAVLATLARGAVFVPIDPSLPLVQRRRMIEQSGATCIVEAGHVLENAQLASGPDVRRFSLPPVPVVTSLESTAAAGYNVPPIEPDAPAYVVFTSGTTGKPKGILGAQRGLAHFLEWERELTGMGPGDRVPQLTGLSFDVVLRDLFLPLTSGAAMLLPPNPVEATAPSDLLRWLEGAGATLVHTVPTIAGYWLSDRPADIRLPSLRWVLFAGEPLPAALVQRWRDAFATPRIGNLYGPTETTLAKLFYEVPDPPDPGIQPVGHAIPGAQALVMHGADLADPGEVGEIVIRTPYRSLGYLGAESHPPQPFTSNPFTKCPDDLVYRTGDRGRRRTDGILEIHGRLDDQVKIHGVRVEPAEVAAELASHPDIQSAAVVARPDPQGSLALVAYVVSNGPTLKPEALRAFLADRLMSAKVPRRFVMLSELPRTPNGKVDRGALPSPRWEGVDADPRPPHDATRPAAPVEGAEDGSGRGGREETNGWHHLVPVMTSIFADLLPANDVTPDDDFFALGGHSLQAARLIHRVHEATGSRIQVRSLFEAPTPRALAALVGSQPVGERRSEASIDPSVRASAEGHVTPKPTARGPIPGSIVPIRPGGTHGPLFVVPGVGSRILFLRHLARHLGPDVPLYALHADRLEDGSIYRRIEDLAARYARDLRHVQPSGPYRLLGFSFGGLVAFEVAQVLRAAGDEVEFLGIVDTRLPQQADQRAWSVLRSVPRRLMNLGAILQPLSGPARRSYLRTRLLVARQNGIAHLVGSFRERFPRGLFGWAPEHPFGPDEPEWLAADQAAWGRYRARPYPGKVVYFWAQHSQRPPDVRDNREGWAELALGGLEVRPIPGSHLTVLLEPLVRSSARAIRAELLVRR